MVFISVFREVQYTATISSGFKQNGEHSKFSGILMYPAIMS